MTTHRIRVGIDVGGTFTDAVAVDATTLDLLGQVKVPTSHHHEDGVAHGIVEALDRLMEQTGHAPEDVAFLAHGTTQATNALLEGDVATVGLLGIGTGAGRAFTRRLASLAKLELSPGKRLPLIYAHIADPEDRAAVESAVDEVARGGAQVLVATQPFSVDRPEGEDAVREVAAGRGLPMTAAHDITSLYGLQKRSRTAVVNAAILPKMFATADLVDASITKAGVTAPLMVMRCDGGVMSLDEMRRRPLLTVLSGPAAGVAGALMRERVSEGVFLETGGTSTDISVVRRGKVAVRHATLLGKTSYLSALDVRTVGVGGGSMIRISGGKVTTVGPRSAHIAGLPYACFASADDLAGARLTTVRPLPEDAEDHVVLDAAGGRYALTLTCAANALGRVPEGDFARADHEVARAALAPLAAALGTDVDTAATRVLDAAIDQVRSVVDTMIDDYRLDKDTVLLVGGEAAPPPSPRTWPPPPATRAESPRTARSSAPSGSPSPSSVNRSSGSSPARTRRTSSRCAPRPNGPSSPRAPPPTPSRWRSPSTRRPTPCAPSPPAPPNCAPRTAPTAPTTPNVCGWPPRASKSPSSGSTSSPAPPPTPSTAPNCAADCARRAIPYASSTPTEWSGCTPPTHAWTPPPSPPHSRPSPPS